jgi:hypothetical protein
MPLSTEISGQETVQEAVVVNNEKVHGVRWARCQFAIAPLVPNPRSKSAHFLPGRNLSHVCDE